MNKDIKVQPFYLREGAIVDGKFVPAKNKHPVGCICLHQTANGNIIRGISICARTDNWSKAMGRERAERRVLRGLKYGRNEQPIGEPVLGGSGHELERREAAIEFLMHWRARFPGCPDPTYKVAINPRLNDFEKHILAQAQKNQQPPVAELKDVPSVGATGVAGLMGPSGCPQGVAAPQDASGTDGDAAAAGPDGVQGEPGAFTESESAAAVRGVL